MVSRKVISAFALMGSFGLAACSAQQCDPNNVNIFSGIGCAAGNGYSDRTQHLQAERDALQQRAQQASAESSALNQSVSQAKATVADKKAALRALDGRIKAAKGRLAKAQASKSAVQADYKKTLADLERQRAELARTPSPTPAQIQHAKMVDAVGDL